MSHDLDDCEEKSSKRIKTEEVDQSKQQTNNDKIFKNDLILNHILKNLTPRQLSAISRVCKVWHNQCLKLIKQYSKSEDLFLIYGLTNFMRNNPNRFLKLIQLKDLQNYENLKDEILSSIQSKDKLQTVPLIALFFNSFRSSKQKNYLSFLNSNKLLSSLPRSCSIISLLCTDTGVIGNSPNNEYSVETMQDHKFISGISYLFLPDLTEYGCQIIPIKGCQSQLYRYLNEEQIFQHNIKGVLTFIKFDTSKSPNLTILRELLGQNSNKVALGGILIEDIDVSSNVDCKNSNHNDPKSMVKTDFAALMFCGENVNCASIVIKDAVEDDVKKLLINFKNNLHFDYNENDSELFGFVFACAGRSFNIFDKLNLESDLIKEQFPKIRLYGIHGLGEIGLNYFGNNRSNKIKKNTILHYYTTVLVIVHISKNKIHH